MNTNCFESDAVFSGDQKKMLFTSDRPDNLYHYLPKNYLYAGETWGNTDILIADVDENGNYSNVKNLGPIINTPGAERTPFLHPDGVTLYFSSNGHNGFGDLDIFKTVRLDDTWTNWSKPVNIGKSINGIGSDWGFVMAAVSDKGYFSAKSEKNNNLLSLFEILPLPIRARPVGGVLMLIGRILDKNGKPIPAKLVFKDLKTGKVISFVSTRPGTGEFSAFLPIGKKISYSVLANNYTSEPKVLDLGKNKKFKEIFLKIPNLPIQNTENPIQPREVQDLSQYVINFTGGKDKILKDSYPVVDDILFKLSQKGNPKILIEGHTATGGTEAFNIRLSKKRANSVAKYMISKGYPKDNITTKGAGSKNPVAPNNSESNRKRNRRVVFYSKPD